MQQVASATRNEISEQIEVFHYPAGTGASSSPMWEDWAGSDESDPAQFDCRTDAARAAMRAVFDKRLADDTRRSFEAGRERGRLEGRQAESEAQAVATADAVKQRTRQAAELIEAFAQERDRFLHSVEHEVVQLALAVAARILRREAQMDPLLLTGAVRVALGQLSESTRVKLLVPSGELDLWTEAMALLPRPALKPTVVTGEGMRLGDCRIETEQGAVDLGIRSQLGEIERGFFDRAGGTGATPNAASTAIPAVHLEPGL